MPGDIYFCPHFSESLSQWFCACLFDMMISDVFFPSNVQGNALFTNITYTYCATLGVLGECFSPLSSPHSTQPQPPDDGDGERLVNRSGVEMGGPVSHRTKIGGASVGHWGLFPETGPPKIDRQEGY